MTKQLLMIIALTAAIGVSALAATHQGEPQAQVPMSEESAPSDDAGSTAETENQLVDGTVTKVDRDAGKITIKHGPITKLGMDEGMTMVFRAQDPLMLETVKAGDDIRFDADRVNGQFTVIEIETAQ